MPQPVGAGPPGGTGSSRGGGSTRVAVTASTPVETELSFVLGEHRLETIDYRGRRSLRVRLPRSFSRKQKDAPELPVVRTDLIVPRGARIAVEVTAAEFEDIPADPPLPSAGFVSRDGPQPMAAFGPVYDSPAPFPAEAVTLTDSYRIRRVDGVGVLISPFQYLPAANALRVYRQLTLRVTHAVSGGRAALALRLPQLPAVGPFRQMIAGRFANLGQVERGWSDGLVTLSTGTTGSSTRSSRELPVSGDSLLVVVPTDWAASEGLAAFVEWKRQRGLRVRVARYPDDLADGQSGKDALKAFIQNDYEQNNTAYIILVGDHDDIPVYQTTDPPSDTMYTRIDTADWYHDMLISRVSAGTLQGIDLQFARFVAYEKQPVSEAAWYRKATMIGSNEDNGYLGKKDREVLEEERLELLDSGFSECDQIYDLSYSSPASKTDLVSAWNTGRGLLYYLGHGTVTNLNTPGFAVQDAYALQNGNRLPLVLIGACTAGKFTYATDCLSEALMKAGDGSAPAGAISVISATTPMDWDPPIVMIEAFTSYLTGKTDFSAGTLSFTGEPFLTTAGELAFSSIQRAMDYCYATPNREGPAAAELIMQQTHILGDCTLAYRNAPPLSIVVTHDAAVSPNAPFTVTVTDQAGDPTEGATVCLYADAANQIVSRTDASGQAILAVGVPTLEALTLTVFRRDLLPYQTNLPVTEGGLAIVSGSVLPAGFIDEPYSFTFAPYSGVQPYTWSMASGGVPGLVLGSEGGTLTGTPTTEGTHSITVQLADSDDPPSTVSKTFTCAVYTPVRIGQLSPPAVLVLGNYEYPLPATGSLTPFSWTVSSGELPDGISLSADGVLAGVPLAAGTFLSDVTVTDQGGFSDAANLSITVDAVNYIEIPTASELPGINKGQAYSVQLEARGGSGHGFVWRMTGGALPAGVILSQSGSLSGTPTEYGIFAFNGTVNDDSQPPVSASQTFTLTVSDPVHFTASRLPDAYLGIPYANALPVDGSAPPFSYAALASDGYGQEEIDNTFAETGVLQESWKGADFQEDNEWTLDFGFEFPFYDRVYTGGRVGDNGYLVLGTASPDPKYMATALVFNDTVMIAPFWTDLVIMTEHPGTGIWVDRGPDSITIRWRGLDYHYVSDDYAIQGPDLSTDVVNVSLTLYADGGIRFRYGDVQTCNRVVVGLCNGDVNQRELYFTHVWDPKSPDYPDYLDGWSGRTDLVWSQPLRLPPGLSLQADGTVTGTPTESGDYTFSVWASDADNHSTQTQLALSILTQPPVDQNGNGSVEDGEILAYVDYWSRGWVNQDTLRAAIDQWRSGPTPTRGGDYVSAAPEGPASLRGWVSPEAVRYRIQLVNGTDLALVAETVSLLESVSAGDWVIAYCTPAQKALLEQRGMVISPLPSGPATRERRPPDYYTYTAMEARLAELSRLYPDIATVQSIGHSSNGLDLWTIRITANPGSEEDEPELKLVGSIHGDEPTGMEVCMDFAEWLLQGYGMDTADGRVATDLVDRTEIWILPLMNPDGYVAETRFNANSYDLNRSFPDGLESEIGTLFDLGSCDVSGLQPETAAVMTWSCEQSFVASVGFHSGALLVCYPYGNNPSGIPTGFYAATPDDELYRRLSAAYADNNPEMVVLDDPPGGIVNSSYWFRVTGEMPDWNYRFLGDLEVTVELSNVFTPPGEALPALRANNRAAVVAFLAAARGGIRGLVTDAGTGDPLRARIRLDDSDQAVYTDPEVGDYHRSALPGTYSVTVSAPGYEPFTATGVTVPQGGEAVRLDVSLERSNQHHVERVLSAAGFIPGSTGTVDLRLVITEGPTPSGVIVTESLPDGWTYVPESARAADGTLLDAPRVHSAEISWLFYGDQVRSFSFSYEVQVPADALADVAFTGTGAFLDATNPTLGDSRWSVQTVEFPLELSAGWNLISVPVRLFSPPVGDVFAGIDGLAAWQWDGIAYEIAVELVPKRGYWIRVPAAVTLLLSGYPETDPVCPLWNGWNLVGPLADVPVPRVRGMRGSVYGWQDGSYTPVQTLRTGRAYWLYHEGNGEILLR